MGRKWRFTDGKTERTNPKTDRTTTPPPEHALGANNHGLRVLKSEKLNRGLISPFTRR